MKKMHKLRVKVAKAFFAELKDYYKSHQSMPTGCLINGVNLGLKSYRDFYFDDVSVVIRVRGIFKNDDYGIAIICYDQFKSILFF